MSRGMADERRFLRRLAMVALVGLGLSGCIGTDVVYEPSTPLSCGKYEEYKSYYSNGQLKERGCKMSDGTWQDLYVT